MKKILANPKTWNMAGVVLGLLVMLVGLVFIFTPADSYSTDTTDYATFGADYYTYQYDATRIVARNAAVTANNLREIGEKLALYSGTAIMIAGAVITLSYGKKLALDVLVVPEQESDAAPEAQASNESAAE